MRSTVTELTRLLGRHPKYAAAELNTIHGLSVAEIADKLEVSYEQVSAWLGLDRPPVVTMADVAERHMARLLS